MSNKTFATQESCPEPAVSQDGSGESGAGAIIGLSVTAGEGGVGGPGVASQGSSYSRWTKRRVQTERISPQKRTPTQPASQPSTSSQVPVSETRNADGREMGDGYVPTLSDNGNFPMVDKEEVPSKKLEPMAKEMIMLIKGLGGRGYLRDYVRVVAGTDDEDSDSELLIPTPWSDESKNEKGQKGGEKNSNGKDPYMPSEAVEQGMDANVPDEIDGAKGE
ncbi:hypothetical protein Tco_0689554 [Tanacetum coccineum]